MPVRLNSSGGGSVTLDVPATAGTFTLNLPAVNGDLVATGGGSTVQFGAGSVSAPSITFSGDTNTGIYSPAADTIAFTEGGVEAMRIDASGNVGIGTSSPVGRLDVRPSANNSAQIQGASHNTLTGLGAGLTYSRGNDGALNLAAVFSWNNGGLAVAGREGIAFATGGGSTYVATVERARIDASGNTYFGSNTAYATGPVTRIYGDAVSGYARIDLNKFSSGTFTTIGFFHRNTSVGVIDVSDTGTSYVTSSDYRLKENVTPLTGAAARVQALKPSRFNFIAAPGRVVDGFLAHEAAEVVPEAVTGVKDAVNEDGSIQAQGIDQSKLVPLLTAALQEALTRIETLEARLAAVEAR